MDIGLETWVFLAYAAVILVVFLFGRLMLLPFKKILKLIINSLVGGVVLLVINMLGAGIGIVLPMNFMTVITAGILGIPGIITMIFYFNLIT